MRFGAVLETFVLGEILKLAGWAEDRYALSHFRNPSDSGQLEAVRHALNVML